jgi:hypothetical protein
VQKEKSMVEMLTILNRADASFSFVAFGMG